MSTLNVVVLVFLLVLWTFGPALMCVDPRDAFPDAGDNIIVFLAIASLCFGAGCCIAFLALATALARDIRNAPSSIPRLHV